MNYKLLEIRDRGTCIPALAINMAASNDIEYRFLRRCGYPRDGHGVVLMHLSTQEASSDPYGHSSARTWVNAHEYIIKHFDQLNAGDVVDVRVILGEEDKAAAAEIYTGEFISNEEAEQECGGGA